jgi:hypothetical protein
MFLILELSVMEYSRCQIDKEGETGRLNIVKRMVLVNIPAGAPAPSSI